MIIENNQIDQLGERIKELNCIYGVTTLIQNPKLTPDEVLNETLLLIQQAWQYPEITCVRININGKNYQTSNFKETEWKQSLAWEFQGKECELSIYYIEEKPEIDEGPFLMEERMLLNAIGDLIGTYLEKIEMDEQLSGMIGGTKKHDWEILLDILIKTDPRGSLRLTRRMIYYLYRIKNEDITHLLTNVCSIDDRDSEWCGINIPNPKEDIMALKRIQKDVFGIAKKSISEDEIDRLFNTWLKADKARPLLIASQKRGITLGEISDNINRYWDMPEDARELIPEDETTIITALIRRFFTNRLKYINIAKKYIKLEDFVVLLKQLVGSPTGEGKLGGKTAGIYLSQKIIEEEGKKEKYLNNIKFAKSWYITSDTMTDVIRYNDLDDIVHVKYQEPGEIRQEHPFLEQLLKNCTFPPYIISGLRGIIEEIGDKPMIVRSSSLLEDSYGAAFSGKYKSLFLVNTGSEEERLDALTNAISEVYASTFAPDPIEYRKERGLLDFYEEMSILIQEVVGTRIGPYFLPVFAGVALSNNEFRWSPRIRREDGIIRIVSGLGTRAVDRVGNDYPVLVSPNRPEIQVNALIDETIQYSQHFMDVINLEKSTMETVETTKLMKRYWDDYPQINRIVSAHREGTLSPVQGIILDIDKTDIVVTFNRLFEKSEFINQMKLLLNTLKSKLETPVDIEFAHDGKDLYLLQCRPQYQALEQERIPIPKNIPRNRRLFTANKYVTTSHIENIEYIVYVDPDSYENLTERNQILDVAKAIGILNKKLPKRKFILMGPGRWGSRGDVKLGVPVQYNDINRTSLLIEIAKKKGTYLPDLSFGTHFFQDLVEANIHYLPLYPDEPENLFNTRVFDIAVNKLQDFSPKHIHLEDVLKVVKVSEIDDGGTLSIIMDGDANTAMAYLVPPDHWKWRQNKAEEIASTIDQELYGIKNMYLVGSTKEGTAGPSSDLDLIIHINGNEEQKEQLLLWLKGQDLKLVEENKDRTGIELETLLDIHLVTDEDIENKSSWASHINNPYDPARKLELPDPNA